MAKAAKKSGGDGARKKARSAGSAEGAKTKTKARSRKAGKAKSAQASAFDSLSRLAEHPIVADLIAVGATAAVAALAERSLGGKDRAAAKSGTAAKAAGKAAAAAIGRRLVSEFNAVKDAAKDAGKAGRKKA